MSEFYINLFEQEDYAGTNRPHFKAVFKIDDVEHDCAFWPNKDGKKGFSGKAKPKVPYVKPQESVETGALPIDNVSLITSSTLKKVQEQFPDARAIEEDQIPF